MSNTENVITLNAETCVKILIQYIELAQQKGAYLLQEAELLKRAVDVVANGQTDHQIDFNTSKNLLVQGVTKGQQKGCYNLSDAALLFRAVQFVESNEISQQSSTQSSTPTQTSTQSPTTHNTIQNQQLEENDVEDLSDLSDPIPFKPKEI